VKIRPIRPLSELEGNIPARQAAAEAHFLKMLAREARGSQKAAQVSVSRRAIVPVASTSPRAQGRAAGAAFAHSAATIIVKRQALRGRYSGASGRPRGRSRKMRARSELWVFLLAAMTKTTTIFIRK
jgi:hypothetical protein